MPIFENNAFANNDGHQNKAHDNSSMLSAEAMMLSATIAAMAVVARKPALLRSAEPELKIFGETVERDLGSSIAGGFEKSGLKAMSKEIFSAGDAATESKLVTGVSAGAKAQVAETSKSAANAELGASYDPKYAARSQPLEARYLGFTRKWPVEGTTINDEGVNLYVTRNGHWVRMAGFEKPPADVHGLDILNTRIGDVRTTVQRTASGEDKNITSVILEMGRREPIKLTGQIKATEFWY